MQFENLVEERILSFLVEEDEQYCNVTLKGDGPIVGKVADKIRKQTPSKLLGIRDLRNFLRDAGVDTSNPKLSLVRLKTIVETIMGI